MKDELEDDHAANGTRGEDGSQVHVVCFCKAMCAATKCGTVSRPCEAACLAPHHAALLRQACHAPPLPWGRCQVTGRCGAGSVGAAHAAEAAAKASAQPWRRCAVVRERGSRWLPATRGDSCLHAAWLQQLPPGRCSDMLGCPEGVAQCENVAGRGAANSLCACNKAWVC